MKKSRYIPLVMLGTMIAGCGQQDYAQDVFLSHTPAEAVETVSVKQNVYSSKEDCVKDWESECKLESYTPSTATNGAATGSHGGTYIYTGPRYFYDHTAGQAMAFNSDGSTRPISTPAVASAASTRSTSASPGSYTRSSTASVSRGGFGGSAHASAGGGGHGSSGG